MKKILVAMIAMMAAGQAQAVLTIDVSITNDEFFYTLEGTPTIDQLGSGDQSSLSFGFATCCTLWTDYISPVDLGSFSGGAGGSGVV
jgi:hypothetical protein